MRLSVYLHTYVTDTLRMFGDLNDVVDRILCEVDVEDKPECPDRNGANRYNIDVINEEYLALIELHGNRSKNISLRRLLYWFVDNEIYNDLGWTPVSDYISQYDKDVNRSINFILGELTKLSIKMSKNVDNRQGTVTHIYDLLSDCKR